MYGTHHLFFPRRCYVHVDDLVYILLPTLYNGTWTIGTALIIREWRQRGNRGGQPTKLALVPCAARDCCRPSTRHAQHRPQHQAACHLARLQQLHCRQVLRLLRIDLSLAESQNTAHNTCTVASSTTPSPKHTPPLPKRSRVLSQRQVHCGHVLGRCADRTHLGGMGGHARRGEGDRGAR